MGVVVFDPIKPNECDPEPPKENILEEANRLVHGARRGDYGHPLTDWGKVAGMFNALFSAKLKAPVTAEDMIMTLVLVKLSRQENKPKRDNIVDGAGYFALLEMCAERRAEMPRPMVVCGVVNGQVVSVPPVVAVHDREK